MNYLQQLSEFKEFNFFLSPWGHCIIKNCGEAGDLLEFETMSQYEKYSKDKKKTLWLLLQLKVFQVPELFQVYGVFLCPQTECNMSSMDVLEAFQSPDDIRSRMCYHSIVATNLVGDWRSKWSVNFSNTGESFELIKEDKEFVTFVPPTKERALLACVRESGRKACLLYCASSRQEVPYCTTCVRRSCHHHKKLLSFNSKQDSLVQNEEEVFETNYDPAHDAEERDFGYEEHYLKPLPKHIHGYLYGYNYSPIRYPFSESSRQQSVWLERLNGQVNVPQKLVPVYDSEYRCKHELKFQEGDQSLVKVSSSVCLINDVGERILESEVFARPSVGPCKCLHRYDGHEYLIWNVGHGRFVDYTLLMGYLHKWRGSGITMHSLFRSIKDCAQSCGVSCSLSYADIHRSICGFMTNLAFDTLKAFREAFKSTD